MLRAGEVWRVLLAGRPCVLVFAPILDAEVAEEFRHVYALEVIGYGDLADEAIMERGVSREDRRDDKLAAEGSTIFEGNSKADEGLR